MYRLVVFICGLLSALTASAQRDTTITVTSTNGLNFDQKQLSIKPNTRLKLIFRNRGDMTHNLVITRPNSRLRVVEAALALGAKGALQNYAPAIDEVLAHTLLVEPGDVDSLTVRLAEGPYPFVCTYPGHGTIMYGVIYATSDPKRIPAPEQDRNLPPPDGIATQNHADHRMSGHRMSGHRVSDHRVSDHQVSDHRVSDHPYPLRLPAVYRTFMPDCGPAAIAVGLPGPDGGQSYVFDAGQCRLRYAWSGGFVDNADQWDGNGRRLSKVVGEIYFRDTAGFPWRIGTETQPPQFKGYRLINRYPEFHYVVNGVDVRELIKPLATGRGLIRTFTLGPTTQALSFIAVAQPGIRIKPSVGRLQNGEVRLPAGTRQFTVVVSTL